MKLNRWTKPGTSDVRYYVDTRFGGSKFATRSENLMVQGYWLQADEQGMTVALHKGDRGAPCVGEDGELVLEFFGAVGLTFEAFEARFSASLTKGGNFSETKYFKTVWPDWRSEAA